MKAIVRVRTKRSLSKIAHSSQLLVDFDVVLQNADVVYLARMDAIAAAGMGADNVE
jgi:hypothetical protein